MRSGITRRWLRGNLLLTVLLLVLVEGMFLYSYTRSYYNGVQQTMVRSSFPIRTNTSSCCWTATAASLRPPAARTLTAS